MKRVTLLVLGLMVCAAVPVSAEEMATKHENGESRMSAPESAVSANASMPVEDMGNMGEENAESIETYDATAADASAEAGAPMTSAPISSANPPGMVPRPIPQKRSDVSGRTRADDSRAPATSPR